MKNVAALLLCAGCLTLCAGCAKSAELSAFHDEMDSFYEGLTQSVSELEAIDPASESAADDMLSCLDEMSLLFWQFSEAEVPEKMEDRIGNVDELADQAAAYMQEACRLWHDAWEGEEYDEAAAQAAQEYYTRAMEWVNYISLLLQGRIPEGEDVTVVAGTEETTR